MRHHADGRRPPAVSVKFYLVGIILSYSMWKHFPVSVGLYLQVVVGWFLFVEMLLYIGILLVGYFYLWKKGALDWNRPAARRDRTS